MNQHKKRVLRLIRAAFSGVTLGDGVGLRQAKGLDDYADEKTLADLRSHDEKHDWSAIYVRDLDRYYSSLSFFDPEGMRFHLPAYLVADLKGTLQTADVLFHMTDPTDYSKSQFENLSDVQRDAVRQFLLLRLRDPNYEFDHPLIESALRHQWIARTRP